MLNSINHIIGLSKIGFKRDLKETLEKCLNFKKDEDFYKHFSFLNELKKKNVYKNWMLQIIGENKYINVGDFSYYDQILETIFNLNFLPLRFKFKYINFKNIFESAKGNLNNQPMEMVKWFNTNYHYVVPEYDISTKFSFNNLIIEKDIKFSNLIKNNFKFIIIGPITLLKLGKIKDNFLKNKILLLPDLLINYISILNNINNYENIKIIQIEEPVSILNLSNIWLNSLIKTYNILCSYFSNILFATYFEKINNNILEKISKIPFFSIHIDLINSNNYDFFLKNNTNSKLISLGIINGKEIWNDNLEKSYYILKKFLLKNKILLSTNCSLSYIPIDKNLEKKKLIIKNWISFGVQKINNLKTLSDVFKKKIFLSKNFIKNIFFIKNKKNSKLIFIKKVQKKIKKLNFNDFKYRKLKKNIRYKIQKNYFNFKFLKSTTIGSFPQTKKIRKIRLDYKKNLIDKNYYENLIKKEIKYIVKKQIDYRIDVLCHGEPERNDMVEYFAELLEGFTVTTEGWVQSYGSRYVKPPIIYGDIYLKNYMTINWIKYSQNFSKKPLKGMLTGPLTILKWSFRRNDQPNYLTSIQISLALNKEILKLESLGIKIIQIDEPAVREFLPIKIENFKKYFNWSIKSFLILYKNIKSETQIHTHICYSEFKNIINFIKDLDVDVVSIETSRSNFQITSKIKQSLDVGLGIYDIHTKRVLNINLALYLIKIIINNLEINNVWINPDCGLKTRSWNDINLSLINMKKSSLIIEEDILKYIT
ncbi:5-methyltetrahydropteroyltriglutamate-homocysteine S-methyltransferase [Candidatus Nasuia deltocephalinicola]|nr:5-methyltetrahydropteroyltriglutamate-homocysteine S-methyltransferase [Candidatus Nasuia deltocephalinicola]